MWRSLTLSIISLIAIVVIPQADAIPYKNAVGIIIEQSCLISPNCLDYKDIIHLDNSKQVYAGRFVDKDDDISRVCTSKQNNHAWLRFEKNFTIMVDPCIRFQNQIRTISIISRLDEYHLPGQQKVAEGGKDQLKDSKATLKIRTYSKDRYVDATCTHAVITSKNWQVILPDTIQFLRSGCDPQHTSLMTLVTDVQNLTKHDITTSYKYKLEKQYSWIKANCLKKFGACRDLGANANAK